MFQYFLTGSPEGGGRESLFCIVEIVLSVEGVLHPILGDLLIDIYFLLQK